MRVLSPPLRLHSMAQLQGEASLLSNGAITEGGRRNPGLIFCLRIKIPKVLPMRYLLVWTIKKDLGC
jgi:hypothetical protein